MEDTYELPVSKLLWIGEATRKWKNYSALGLTLDHAPDLFRMLRDPELDNFEGDDPQSWASLHAWRALAELQAPGLLDAMLERLDRFNDDFWDDSFLCDFSDLAARVGPDSLPELIRYWHDSAELESNRMVVAEAIAAVGRAHSQVKRAATAALEQTLINAASNTAEVNSIAISGLVDLGARDSIDLIRAVMQTGPTIKSLSGELEKIEFDLGFRDRPPERRPWRTEPEDDDENRPDDWRASEWGPALPPLGAATESDAREKRNARERARVRRKLAKAAKKRNRK